MRSSTQHLIESSQVTTQYLSEVLTHFIYEEPETQELK